MLPTEKESQILIEREQREHALKFRELELGNQSNFTPQLVSSHSFDAAAKNIRLVPRFQGKEVDK